MFLKKLGKALLFPHVAVIILFLPLSIAFLVFSLLYLSATSVVSIISYVFATYMLTVLCARIPKMITFFKKVKTENKLAIKLSGDVRLRMSISLYGTLIWNGAYAIFQLGLGFYHQSLWFYTMAAYYVMLAIMRFFLLKHTRSYAVGEKAAVEMKKYLACGCLLLVTNFVLSGVIFFIVYKNQTFHHGQITTIALAAYTFFTLIFAIVNIVKYKKYASPVYSAAKTVTLVAACVSMFTLETTMLNTFGGETSLLFKQMMLGASGVVLVGFITVMAIITIVKGAKGLKLLKLNPATESVQTDNDSNSTSLTE